MSALCRYFRTSRVKTLCPKRLWHYWIPSLLPFRDLADVHQFRIVLRPDKEVFWALILRYLHSRNTRVSGRKFGEVRVAVGKNTEEAYATTRMDLLHDVDDPSRPLYKSLPLGVWKDHIAFVCGFRRLDWFPWSPLASLHFWWSFARRRGCLRPGLVAILF